MPKRSDRTTALKAIPGNIRVVIQVYDDTIPRYCEVGLSMSKIPIRSRKELHRLWGRLQETVERRAWTDLNAGPPSQIA